MVKTIQSSFPSYPNFDRITVSFDKLNNTDLFHHIHWVYIVHELLKVHTRLTGYKLVNQSEKAPTSYNQSCLTLETDGPSIKLSKSYSLISSWSDCAANWN